MALSEYFIAWAYFNSWQAAMLWPLTWGWHLPASYARWLSTRHRLHLPDVMAKKRARHLAGKPQARHPAAPMPAPGLRPGGRLRPRVAPHLRLVAFNPSLGPRPKAA
jgi:hypothetical protein